MRRLIVNVCFKRHGGIPDTNRQRPQRAFPPAPPLSGNLRVWAAPRGARLPLRWGSVAATRFPECPFPRARSFRLRDSGAVAPSAIRICAPNPLPRRGPKFRDSGERKDHGPTILFRQVERLEGRRGDDLIKGFDAFGNNGAQKRTRTSTPFRAPPPEDGASTNSAIWARGRARPLGAGRGQCQHSPCAPRVLTLLRTVWQAAGFSGCSSMAEQKLPKQLAGFLMPTMPSHKWRISALSSYPPLS